jgi:ATP-binding cassette subfamily C protein
MNFKNIKIYSFLKLLNSGFARYKSQILLIAVLGLLGGLFEGVGINAIIPLFSFISGGQRGSDFISRTIQEFFNFLHLNFTLKYLLVFIVTLFIARALFLFWCNFIRVKISANYEEQTRNNLLAKTLKADWPYLIKQKLGHLETISAINVQYGGLLLQYLGSAIMTLGGLVMYIAVAINISLVITLITLALGAFLIFIFQPLVRRARKIAREKEKFNKQVAHYINENITGLKTIKTMLVDNQIIALGEGYFKKLKELVVGASFLRIVADSFIQPIGLIFVCVIFAISYKTSNFNFAALAAVIYLIQRMFVYIQQLQSNIHSVGEVVPYLRGILDYENEVVQNLEKDDGAGHFEFNERLEFKNVNFSYGRNERVLNDVNFSIARGEMVGLIGPSGAGKTTLVDLILRLFESKDGEILLDGKNIDKINLRDWRRHIGYISQDIFLKNDTIAQNIKFYDETIGDKDIEQAAKMANIYDFIQSCPDGFSTVVGERGVAISAGQRQRIIIARILARQPKFLILDEATSFLDSESEVQIQQVMENLKGKLTVLIIAHRLSTIINVDRLIVLADGKIIEQGKPQKLLADSQSYFYKIYNIKK